MAYVAPQPIDGGEQNRGAAGTATVRVSVSSGASARSAALALGGTYILYSDVACFFLVGDSAVASATTTGNPIPSGGYWPDVIKVDNAGNQYIAAITAAGSGTLYICQRL